MLADFREQSDALASQRKKLSDQRAQAIRGSKALETFDKLRDLQEQLAALPEIPWEFDMDLFDQLVEKIVPVSSTELLFKLKCGLELKEVIPQWLSLPKRHHGSTPPREPDCPGGVHGLSQRGASQQNRRPPHRQAGGVPPRLLAVG